MNDLMLLLSIACFFCLIIGIIKPSIVIRWGEKRGRGKVILYYGVGIIVFFILFGITIPNRSEDKTVATVKNNTVEDKVVKKDETKQKAEEVEIISTDYKSFNDPYKEMTDIQKDDFFKNNKGKYVQWTGKIIEVKERYIDIKCDDATFTFDAQCYIVDSERDKLLSLNKGDSITIKGKLSAKAGVIAAWNLSDCTIIQ